MKSKLQMKQEDQPAPDAENSSNPVKLCLVLALADVKGDVEKMGCDRLAGFATQKFRFRFCRVAKGSREIFGQLFSALKVVANGIEERAGGTHVPNGSP